MLEMYYQVPPTPLTLQEMKCIYYLFTYLLFILAELRFEPAALHTPGVRSIYHWTPARALATDILIAQVLNCFLSSYSMYLCLLLCKVKKCLEI